ncbi:MAG: DUF3787 domain-containing protein [Firmicutes bacterium]|nr:DUF3787 domain-containing protein [Bacillota bacterium]NLO66465.1 DUF3787 domain-containing protein [Bacillota bacterium]
MDAFRQKWKKVRGIPVENHSTAAWANIRQKKPASKVPLPGDDDVELAREWVNQNQK